jgi:hypothetical protein
MDAAIRVQPSGVSLDAAIRKLCGGRMYPATILQSHPTRHYLKQRWFKAELKKLRDTMSRMRDIW